MGERARLGRIAVVLLAVAVTAAACQTSGYRNTQKRFDEANRSDAPPAVYAEIVEDLDSEKIEGLDPKLHANAWMILAYAQWKTGRLEDAVSSAERGSRASGLEAGTRDAVFLELLPALVVDSEIAADWEKAGRGLSAADYADYERKFRTGYGELLAAERAIQPTTSEAAKFYVAYQRWRILNNWRLVIASIATADGQPDFTAQGDAGTAAAGIVGSSLKQAANAARDQIPADDPLRELISAQGGG